MMDENIRARWRKPIFGLFIFWILIAPPVNSSMSAVVKIDVKTPLAEKFVLRGIKFGIIFFFERADYKIVEYGEDYTVWIYDYSERQLEDGDYESKLTVAISRPSLFLKREVLAERSISARFTARGIISHQEKGLGEYLKTKISNLEKMDECRAEAFSKKAYEEILDMLKNIQ